MKRKLIPTLFAAAGIAVLAALLFVRPGLFSQSTLPSIMFGTYLMEITVPAAGQTFKAFANFGNGGQITTSTEMDFGRDNAEVFCGGEPVPVGKFRTAGYGTWRPLGLNRIAWTLYTQRFDSNGTPLGFERVSGITTASLSGEIKGTGQSDFFGPKDDPITGIPRCTFPNVSFTVRRLPLFQSKQLTDSQ